MKKIIFITVPMKSKLEKHNYSKNNEAYVSDREVIFPINSVLEKSLNYNDDVKIVLIAKQDPDKNYIKNIESYKAEFALINNEIGAKVEYEIIESKFIETRINHNDLLKRLVATLEDNAEIMCDMTYGAKTTSIIIFSLLNFAEKFAHADILNIVYGKVDFKDGKSYNPELYDVTSLYYTNSIMASIECDSLQSAKKLLNTVIDI